MGADAHIFIDGLPVLGIKLQHGEDHGQDAHANEEDAQNLLHAGSQVRTLVVNKEEEQGDDQADHDMAQIDIRSGQRVQGSAGLDAGDQDGRDVNHIDGLPGHQGQEGAQGTPTGQIGNFFTECLVGKGSGTAGHRHHGNQLGEAQADGNHHDQSQQVAERSGNRTAAAGHPFVQGDGPAHADDGAKANTEKVERA